MGDWVRFARWLFLFTFLLISGCSKQTDVSDYLRSFDHILTDQYVWSYGQGGIYWVSNDQVVLEARIKNEKGELDRGLYQVDVRDGTYLKIVEISGQPPLSYKYCFDGKALHVLKELGNYRMVNAPKGYEVVIRELGKLTDTNSYSPLRCGFVEKPAGPGGYAALRPGDGFIKHQWESDKDVHVYLADDSGTNLKKLLEQKVVRKGTPLGMFTVRYFLESENAYFGYSPWDNKDCSELWWLYRDDWRLLHKTVCLGELASGGSRLLHSLNGSIYLEHYGGRKGRSYILVGNEWLPVEKNHGRGATVSPNGCSVAYGEGDINGKSGVRQKLKVFNYCDYQQKGL